jgi:hypothetical protein
MFKTMIGLVLMGIFSEYFQFKILLRIWQKWDKTSHLSNNMPTLRTYECAYFLMSWRFPSLFCPFLQESIWIYSNRFVHASPLSFGGRPKQINGKKIFFELSEIRQAKFQRPNFVERSSTKGHTCQPPPPPKSETNANFKHLREHARSMCDVKNFYN